MQELAQQLLNGVTVGSSYAVVALGFGLVFSVMHLLNMSHPELGTVGAYTAFVISTEITDNLVVMILGSILLALLFGLVIERLAIRPTRGRHYLTPFVVTLGVAIAIQYGAQALFGVSPVRVAVPIQGVEEIAGVFVTRMQLLVFALSLLMLVAVRYYIRNTRWGLASRAVAENHMVAAGLGINVNRVSQLTLGLAAALAGAAGAGVALSLGFAAPFVGATLGVKSFVAMIVAGNKNIEGIIVVAMALGILESLVAGYVSSQMRDALAYGVLLLILFVKPKGLFGSYDFQP